MAVEIVKKKGKQKEQEKLRLDLACGQSKVNGFTGVDSCRIPGVDVVHDLLKFPWPFKDNSVDEIWCSHFFEHVPGLMRPRFMDEVYRIMKEGIYEKDGSGNWVPQNNSPKVTIISPYWTADRSIQDFSHEWPPISEKSFLYFNKGWRENVKLTHGVYNMKCDFDFCYFYSVQQPWSQKAEEARSFACHYYNNAIFDVQIILNKRPKNLK